MKKKVTTSHLKRSECRRLQWSLFSHTAFLCLMSSSLIYTHPGTHEGKLFGFSTFWKIHKNLRKTIIWYIHSSKSEAAMSQQQECLLRKCEQLSISSCLCPSYQRGQGKRMARAQDSEDSLGYISYLRTNLLCLLLLLPIYLFTYLPTHPPT